MSEDRPATQYHTVMIRFTNLLVTALTGIMLAVYACLLGIHLLLEGLHVSNHMPRNPAWVTWVPGVSGGPGSETLCADRYLAGTDSSPDVSFDGIPCQTPVQLVQIRSRLIRKYWINYYDADNRVVFRREVVV